MLLQIVFILVLLIISGIRHLMKIENVSPKPKIVKWDMFQILDKKLLAIVINVLRLTNKYKELLKIKIKNNIGNIIVSLILLQLQENKHHHVLEICQSMDVPLAKLENVLKQHLDITLITIRQLHAFLNVMNAPLLLMSALNVQLILL